MENAFDTYFGFKIYDNQKYRNVCARFFLLFAVCVLIQWSVQIQFIAKLQFHGFQTRIIDDVNGINFIFNEIAKFSWTKPNKKKRKQSDKKARNAIQ